VLHTSATTFAILGTGGAVGGIIGSLAAPWISRTVGSGPSLALTMGGGALGAAIMATTSSWPVVWLATLLEAALGSLWNVITVSLRQSIIPDRLLGRVNSVYRFLGWGMMPIGSLVGAIVVGVADEYTTREVALRLPFVIAVVGYLALLAFGTRRLTTAKIEAARAAGKAPSPAAV
jgi:MFS family permease